MKQQRPAGLGIVDFLALITALRADDAAVVEEEPADFHGRAEQAAGTIEFARFLPCAGRTAGKLGRMRAMDGR